MFLSPESSGLRKTDAEGFTKPLLLSKSDYAMPLLSKDEQNNRASGAKDRFFLPWSGDFRHSKDDLLWPFNAYLPGKVYGENERPREKGGLTKFTARRTSRHLKI